MSEFTNFEPMFQETYKFILDRLKSSLIDVMDETWRGSMSWIKIIVIFLAAISHFCGVVERFSQGADLVEISTELSTTLILLQVFFLGLQMSLNKRLIKSFILNLGCLWRTDDQLRPAMIPVKHDFFKTFIKRITVFYKVLTTYILLYMLPRLTYVAVKTFILKEKVAFVMPFYVKMPFKYDDNFLLYTLVYLADIKLLLDAGYIVTFDLILMNAAMQHLQLQFLILQNDLTHIGNSDAGLDNRTSERTLKKLIPRHQELLRLMTELSKAFGAVFLIHLAFFSGTMCFFGFAARIKPSPESIKNLLASNIILVCIYSCCYCGQNLTDASVNIAQAAYEGQWHQRSQEYKKCILFVMLRSQKAQYIKSTSFTDVSLETFTKITNNAPCPLASSITSVIPKQSEYNTRYPHVPKFVTGKKPDKVTNLAKGLKKTCQSVNPGEVVNIIIITLYWLSAYK